MIKNPGVYTIKCPTCSRIILIHLLSDETISHKKCSDCQMEFEGIDIGEGRNSFVVVPKEKKTTLFGNEVAEEAKKTEETPKTEEKKADENSFETFLPIKKAPKKSFRW